MNPINIHQYPEGCDSPALLQYKIAVMQAYADGQPLEASITASGRRMVRMGLLFSTIPLDGWHPVAAGQPIVFDWAFSQYRIAAPKSRFFCFNAGTLFGPTDGPASTRYCLEAKPDGTVVYLHLDGHLEPAPAWTLDRCVSNSKVGGSWKEFDGSMEGFRQKPAPKIADGHNPAKLTEDQIGIGFRTITTAENEALRLNITVIPNLEHWVRGWNASSSGGLPLTYRIPAQLPADHLFIRLTAPKPVIASGHNPAGLTEDQVGVKEGWRLLAENEIGEHAKDDAPGEIQGWNTDRWNEARGNHGWYPESTYRTKAAPGRFVGKPKPQLYTLTLTIKESPAACVPRVAEGHNPENLTAQQLEAEQGWRLLTTEEHEHLRSLNTDSLTRDQLPLHGSDLECRCHNRDCELEWKSGHGGRPAYTYRTKRPAGWYTALAEEGRRIGRMSRNVHDIQIAEGHNPDRLTNAEVGVTDGWRLLSRAEVEHRASQPNLKPTRNLQIADDFARGRWIDALAMGNALSFVYRTKLPAGHFLPRPKPTTIRGWLETLPNGYAVRALKHCNIPGSSSSSLVYALQGGFYWEKTAEGHDFWEKVRDWAKDPKANRLPALPKQ